MKRYLDTEEADYVTFTDRLANALGKIPSSAAAKQLYRAAKALNAEATSVKKLTLSAMLGTTAWSQRSLTYSLGFIRNLYNSG